ncbi:NUDIX domain-containing protein [candidate division KSB1 bacterium]|nr:NUDIX hydrolase [candidate division KSB1 bacterium]RQW05391.1 MAG: NUDIX domain-containing protein [candidate division KSB1 bacterium]
MDIPQWLVWAREIQALSQTGLAFAHNEYDIERNKRFLEIAAEIIETYSQYSKERLVHDFIHQPGYATPKIDVRGALIQDGKILLVKEKMDGKWCMPGGWVDVGEAPAASIIREVKEESGFDVTTNKIIAVYDANRSGRPLSLYHAFKIIFLCDIVGGRATTSFETDAVDFFAFNNLPELSENRTNSYHLAEVREHILNKNRPTSFD